MRRHGGRDVIHRQLVVPACQGRQPGVVELPLQSTRREAFMQSGPILGASGHSCVSLKILANKGISAGATCSCSTRPAETQVTWSWTAYLAT